MASSSYDQPPQDIQQNTTTPPHDDYQFYDLKMDLFKAAMSHEWKTVLSLYKNFKQVRDLKITLGNDTVLHIAISGAGATQNIVLNLLQIVESENDKVEMEKILEAQNTNGDTPLHLAAVLGLDMVCKKIAELKPDMVTTARNKLGETPLFLAVRHRKKYTFYVLEKAIHDKQGLQINEESLSGRDITHCRRFDGNSILHYAIKGEHFGLAYEIIQLYPQLVNYVNSKGETALHTLANKPSVFKSGTRFGFYDRIIYYWIITEPLKFNFNGYIKFIGHSQRTKPLSILKVEDEVLPPTYKACIGLFSLMQDLISYIVTTVASNLRSGMYKSRYSGDEENQSQKEDEYMTSEDQKQRRWFPQNYDVAVAFFKTIIKLLLVVLLIGSRRPQKMAKLKPKHKSALTVMKLLVDRSKLWEYKDTSGGMKPLKFLLPLSPDIGSASPPPRTSTEETDPGSEEKQPDTSKGLRRRQTIATRKQEHKGALTILEQLAYQLELWEDEDTKGGIKPLKSMLPEKTDPGSEEKQPDPSTESPTLLAAKNGITEMVKSILDKFPVAIWDQDKHGKNIVLLAAEHRQASVYNIVLRVPLTRKNLFGKVDNEGNSALHLAANLSPNHTWSIPGAVLQMQFESKWYKYVLSSMDEETSAAVNKEGKTAHEIYVNSHGTLVEKGRKWLTNTSQSCSVVAALVATVAFASASTVPGSVNQESGFPILGTSQAFHVFAISSLVALCFSVTSLIMFLSILTSMYQINDYEKGLPAMLILGLTTLCMSIASILVSFCAGDIFVVEGKLKFVAYPIYAIMCFPVTFFAIGQFPVYFVLIKQMFTSKPY